MFLLYGICTHSVDPSLTHFLGELPGLGLALVPDVVVPEAEQVNFYTALIINFYTAVIKNFYIVLKKTSILP